MNRQIIPVHTIEQWFALHKSQQEAILVNVKLRDRLWKWRLAREYEKPAPLEDPKWVPCNKCEKTGWIQLHPRYPGIHPSQVATSCLLKVWKEMMGQSQTNIHEANSLLIFDIGTAAHEMIQGYGERGAWGSYYKKEVDIGDTPIAEAYKIEGHCDADNILVIEEISGHPIYEVGVVHEYKTINDNGFQQLKNRPKPMHKQQAMLYSACLNRPIVAFLYLNKNNCNIADFPVAFDPNLWKPMEDKLIQLNKHFNEQSPPPADVGYHCGQCGYKAECEAYQIAKKKPS